MSEVGGVPSRHAYQREALQLMERALDLLDRDEDTPGELGAQLDLIICRLREMVGTRPMDGHDSSQVHL